MSQITVTIAVTIDGATQTYTADADSYTSNPFRIASGLLDGVKSEAQGKLNDAKYEWDRVNR